MQQQPQQLADSDLLDPKNSSDQFARYQQMLPSLRRPGRSLHGIASGPSPPPSPPGDLDPDLANMPPLFDFGLFHPDRARGKNTRLPVAVTSTLHSHIPTHSGMHAADLSPADDLVLQALLGDATSFAASNASQLHSAAAADRQQIQNTLAQQRIEQVAASAQELLRGQGPSFPLHSSNRFPSPPLSLPSGLDFTGRDRAFANLLQQPNQLVSSMEHYEPQGSGRPGRTHGQQPSFQSPPQSWIHRPVPSRRVSNYGSALSPLPSPPALVNTQHHQQQTSSSLQSMLPWDFNRWGGLPTDIEANFAQSSRQRQQQQHQMTHSAPLGAAAMDAAQHNPESGFRHLTSENRRQPQTFTFLPSHQSGESQAGFRDQTGSPFPFLPSATAGASSSAEQYGFADPQFGNEEASNEAFMAYSRRLVSQGPNQDLLQLPDRQTQLPWGAQVSYMSSTYYALQLHLS